MTTNQPSEQRMSIDKPEKISIGFHGGQVLAAGLAPPSSRSCAMSWGVGVGTSWRLRMERSCSTYAHRLLAGCPGRSSRRVLTMPAPRYSRRRTGGHGRRLGSCRRSIFGCSGWLGRAATAVREMSAPWRCSSAAGEHGACWLALGALGFGFSGKPEARAWRRGLQATVLSYGLNYAVKLAIKRPRPQLRAAAAVWRGLRLSLVSSAHATTSFAAAGMYALRHRRAVRARPPTRTCWRTCASGWPRTSCPGSSSARPRRCATTPGRCAAQRCGPSGSPAEAPSPWTGRARAPGSP